MRRFGVSYIASCALLVSMAAAPAMATDKPAVTASPTAAPVQQTLQQAFNQASEANERGDCATALPIFERLASDPRVKPGSLAAGTIAVRRGICLSAGFHDDEARETILTGLPILQKAGPNMVADVADGEEALGNIAARRRDHDAAISRYKAAMALRGEPDRVQLLIKLARVSQFDGGPEAMAYTDEALRIVKAQSKPDRSMQAAIRTVRGRILMNQGANKEALAELKEALALSGGLTSKVSLEEASMRGDLAQAALLNGDKDQARLYLAYTGAGRIEESPFAVAASMAPPQCGPETGLSPTDSAIVEFSIDAAGDVPVARTVYTRGGYAAASAFAHAVEQWFWQPENLAKIPPFYKLLTRVELRCSVTGGQLPDISSPLRDRFIEWAAPLLGGVDIEMAKVGSSLERLAILAKQRESVGDKAGAIAAGTMRAILNPYPNPDDFAKVLEMAGAASVPTDAINAILVFRMNADYRQRQRKSRRAEFPAVDTVLRTYPLLSADALASDTLLLLATPSSPPLLQRGGALEMFKRVADDDRLPAHHPLRQVALLRLANLSASDGKLDEAQAYFGRTGLTEEQCSLIGVAPAMKASGISSNDFPREAMRYGFEGWVNLEFDINANGTTARSRPIIAYPPFVFVDAASGMSRGVRYQTSYRPSNALACSAQRLTIRFMMPRSRRSDRTVAGRWPIT